MDLQRENFSLDLQYKLGTTKESTNSNFTTNFGKEITLDPGTDWEVGIRSIVLDKYADTVNNRCCKNFVEFDFIDGICLMARVRVNFNNHCSVITHAELIDYIYQNSPIVRIKCTNLESDYRLCKHRHEKHQYEAPLTKLLEINYETCTGMFKFKQQENLKHISAVVFRVKIGQGISQVGEIFGVKNTPFEAIAGFVSYTSKFYTYFDKPSQMLKSISHIKIHCSIAGKSPILNESGHLGIFPYVAWIQDSKNLDNCTIDFKYPIYVPVNSTSFQRITIILKRAFDNEEELVFSPTSSNRTGITLVFRKREEI